MTELKMPKLSDTMLEGTLVKWQIKVGDKISVGDVIADVETDKATMEMEAFDDGILNQIVVPEGGIIKVGECIALIEGGKPNIEKTQTAEPAAEAPVTTTSKIVAPLAPLSPKPKPRPTVTREGSGAKASPLARKIALERGVDLSRITGTGPGGPAACGEDPLAIARQIPHQGIELGEGQAHQERSGGGSGPCRP